MRLQQTVAALGTFLAAIVGGPIPVALGQTSYEPYTFTTFAALLGGLGNVDGTGSDARFYLPAGIAVDDEGNLYVADEGNSTIRKVSSTGVVTTLAGLAGQGGHADGVGRVARFGGPASVAVDSAGNVYVADSSFSTIRKITPAGIVTTMAGLAGYTGSADGTGSEARFRNPRGVAVDGSGNILVADSGNHTIRRITPDGVVSTLAGLAGSAGSADGNGSDARFDTPCGVAVDGAGVAYVADTYNHTIRNITSAGTVSTFAGLAGGPGAADGFRSDARFYRPWGLAVSSAGYVTVADSSAGTIRRITPSGFVSTLAGQPNGVGSADGIGSDARFRIPYGVAEDSVGDVFVADTGNHTIRKITPAAMVTTFAGRAGAGRADGPGGIARLDTPSGTAVDSMGNVYVTDTANFTIRKITPAGVMSTLAGFAGNPGSADGDGDAARFYYPQAVAVDGAGIIYVADSGNFTIRRISATGAVTTFAGSPGYSGSDDGIGSDARFSQSCGVAVDRAGNVYVADTFSHTIRRITPAGLVTTFAGLAGHCGSENGAGSDARFCNPFGIAVDGAGNVIVTESANSTIRAITPSGVVSTLAGLVGTYGSSDGPASAARFNRPHGVAVDGAGNIFVADTSNHTIRKIDPAGVVRTLGGVVGAAGGTDGVGSGAMFSSPTGLAVDEDGVLYVADREGNAIRRGFAEETVTSPQVPSGAASGQVNVSNVFTTGGSTSSLGHAVQYRFEWGDGTDSGWLPAGTAGASKSWPDAGTYEVRAQARSSVNVVVESPRSSALAVTITGPPSSGPDLTGWWNSLTHSCRTKSGVQKCTIKGRFTVKNEGDQAAGSNRLTWWLSTGADRDGADQLLKTSTVPRLKPTKKKSVSLSYALAPGATAKGKYLIAVVDADDALPERNEANNQIARGPM